MPYPTANLGFTGHIYALTTRALSCYIQWYKMCSMRRVLGGCLAKEVVQDGSHCCCRQSERTLSYARPVVCIQLPCLAFAAAGVAM